MTGDLSPAFPIGSVEHCAARLLFAHETAASAQGFGPSQEAIALRSELLRVLGNDRGLE